jgi:hypothetical protein
MRVLVLLLALPLLAGCTDAGWNRLMTFGGTDNPVAPAQVAQAAPAKIAQMAPTPAGAQPAPPAPDPFCLGVAKQDATTSGFDAATQGRVAIRSYQQCVGLFGASAGK